MFNPTGRADKARFDTLFGIGAVVAVEPRGPTQSFDLMGHQLFGGTYSTATYTDLDQRAADLIIARLPVSKHGGSWSFYCNFDQHLNTQAFETY